MEETHEDGTWNDWFAAHGPRLLLCARQWTRSLTDAEDVVQEAFVRFWRHQRQLPGDPQALLITSVRRAALDLARRESRRVVREDRAAGEAGESTAYFEPALGDEGERRRELERALQVLPNEQREVLVLKIWSELTFDEIARTLGISPNTAASRYRYAMAALRKELKPVCRHG